MNKDQGNRTHSKETSKKGRRGKGMLHQKVPLRHKSSLKISSKTKQTVLSAIASPTISIDNPQDIPISLNSDCPVIGTTNETNVSAAASSSTIASEATCVPGTSSTETTVSAAVAEQQEYRPKKIIGWSEMILQSNVGKTVRDDMTVKDFCSQIDIHNKLSKLEVLDNSPDSAIFVYELKDELLDEPFCEVLRDYVMYYAINVYEQMSSLQKSDKSSFVSEFHKKCPPAFTYFSARFFPPEITELTFENVVNFLTSIGIISIFQRYRE